MAIDFTTLKKKQDTSPPRLLIYGMEKIGKTTLAAGAPDVIFLMTEDGAGLNEISGVEIKSYDDLVDCLKGLATQEHGFRTIALDTATGIEKLVFAKVCDEEKVDSIEKAMGGFGKGYIRAAELMQALIAMIDYVRIQKQMMILLLAHADVVRFTPPDSDPYDRYSVRMNKQVLGALQRWVDGIFFVKRQVSLFEDKITKKKRAVGGDQRFIHTSEQAAFFGGNRYDLPEIIGPVTKGAPELWCALVAHVPFLRDRYGAGKPAIAVMPEQSNDNDHDGGEQAA